MDGLAENWSTIYGRKTTMDACGRVEAHSKTAGHERQYFNRTGSAAKANDTADAMVNSCLGRSSDGLRFVLKRNDG
jgi:hypothetical protein